MKNQTLIIVVLLVLFGCSQVGKQNSVDLHLSLSDSKFQHPLALLFDDGAYRLFTNQETEEEKLEWIQLKSEDLLLWERVPMQIHSMDSAECTIKTVVSDWNQTTSFSNNGPALIAMGTNNNSYGELVVWISHDHGLTWENEPNSKIELPDFFEPIADLKAFWDQDREQWILLTLSAYEIRFYASADFKNWEYLSRFGDDVYLREGQWTKIDFFPMDDTQSQTTQWVLFISADNGSPNESNGVQYFVGDFDGFIYHSSHNKPKWVDHGSDLYQAIVLADYKVVDKNPVLIGKISGSDASRENTSNLFSIARVIQLEEEFHDYYLRELPVSEVDVKSISQELIHQEELYDGRTFKLQSNLPCRINLTFDVDSRLYLGLAETFGVKIRCKKGTELFAGYQAERRYFFVAEPATDKNAQFAWKGFNYFPYVCNEPSMDLSILLDKNSVELFAMDGLVSLTKQIDFDEEGIEIEVFAENGKVNLLNGSIEKF